MRPLTTLSLFVLVFLIPVFSLSAQQRHIHSSAGVGGPQIPLWAGRDLGTFRKYQLDVEGVLILGGARGMQALLGGSAARLTAMDARGLDATVISYDHALVATQKGMTILGDLAEITPEFPDRLIVVRRSFLDKERNVIKRFLQALSESIYQVNTQREKILPVITRHLQVDRKVAEETYDLYHNVFSLPPRVGRKGFKGVLDIVLQQMGRPKEEVNLSRLIDESLIDELEREGFFNRLQKEYTQR